MKSSQAQITSSRNAHLLKSLRTPSPLPLHTAFDARPLRKDSCYFKFLQSELDNWLVGNKRSQACRTSEGKAHLLKTLRAPFSFAARYGVRPRSSFTQGSAPPAMNFNPFDLGFLSFCVLRCSMVFACLFVLTRETRCCVYSGSESLRP
jgi:hypothetical protein